MPKAQRSTQFRVLCHEHHVEMIPAEVLLPINAGGIQTPAYSCPQSGCAVHYTPSDGYFLLTEKGHPNLDGTPRVKCPQDGGPMYLAALNPEKRDFRLWRCPQCDSSRTNEEGLANDVS